VDQKETDHSTHRGRKPSDVASKERRTRIAELEKLVTVNQRRLEELKSAESKAQRSARRKQLDQLKYSIGGLAQVAGLLDEDRGLLLGAMLTIAKLRDNEGRWPEEYMKRFKEAGDAVLAKREQQRVLRRQALATHDLGEEL
jgi:hypothetical protein